MSHQAFSRFTALMQTIQRAMEAGISFNDALANAGPYTSRGKGGKHKARHSRPIPREARPSKKHPHWAPTPHDGLQQAARQRHQGQHMTVVNGFRIMNAGCPF